VVIEKKINFAKMNNKNSLLLVDPEFDPQAASDCALLLKITTDSFSYAIINKNKNQLLVVFDHQECTDVWADLNSRFQTDPNLSLDFKEAKMSVHTPNSIAIPGELYEDQYLSSYKNAFKEEVDEVYTHAVPNYGLQLVYALAPAVEQRLHPQLLAAGKYEHTAPLLSLARDLPGHTLILDFTVSSCNAVLKNGDQLIFSNYFETEDAEEFHYFLALMIQQLHIQPPTTIVFLSGIVNPGDEKYNCIQKYFDHIEFLGPNIQADCKILEDMPAHYYSSLLAIDLCV